MCYSIATGAVRSVNVSSVRTLEIGGRPVTTGIFKTPVAGRVALRGVNLEGDDQADRTVHGGPERAVYAYACEDYDWWGQRLGRELTPGTFGENLTLADIDVSGARIGERWKIGSALLAVTSPRVPCFKLAHAMNDPAFVRAFAHALRPGAYLRVVEEGDIAAGDTAEVVARPSHDLSVAEMAAIYLFERSRAAEMLAVSELSGEWRTWAIEQVRGASPQ